MKYYVAIKKLTHITNKRIEGRNAKKKRGGLNEETIGEALQMEHNPKCV